MASEGENGVTEVQNLSRDIDGLESSTDEPDIREEEAHVSNSDEDEEAPREDEEQQAEAEAEVADLESVPESQGSAGRDTEGSPDEGSPLYTPGGTPIAKHVQFEEVSQPEDPERDQAEEDTNDSEHAQSSASAAQERVSENGYDESADKVVDLGDGSEHEPNPEASTDEVDVQPLAPPVVVPVAGGNGASPAVTEDNPNNSKPKPEPIADRSPLRLSGSSQYGSTTDDMRCKWGCCCGFGWFMVGVVAAVSGVMLVVYLRQFWKSAADPTESLLLYFGIGACVFGTLMLLIGFAFWTCACIYWRPSGYPKDSDRQTYDLDPESAAKMKNANHVTGDYVTSNTKDDTVYYVNSSDNDRQNGSTTPVADETFLV